MVISKLKYGLIVCSAVALFVAAGYARELYNNRQAEIEIRRLEERARALEAEKISIVELKNRLASQDFLEEEARLKLGLKKPGETTVVVPEKDSEGGESLKNRESEASSVSSESSAKLWLRYFFK